MGGEKIDVIEWSEDPTEFVSNSLSPAKVLDVEVSDKRRDARAIVPEEQLSLAIGKGGQNVRLAAKLTGWKIDVRSSKPPVARAEEDLPAEAPAEAGQEDEMELASVDGAGLKEAIDEATKVTEEKSDSEVKEVLAEVFSKEEKEKEEVLEEKKEEKPKKKVKKLKV